eukprot:2069468-Alexandrium_andersonii.AAC.1
MEGVVTSAGPQGEMSLSHAVNRRKLATSSAAVWVPMAPREAPWRTAPKPRGRQPLPTPSA